MGNAMSAAQLWNVATIGQLFEVRYGKANPGRDGKVPVIGSSGVYAWTDAPLVHEPTIVVGRKGSAGQVWFIDKPCFPSDTTFYLVRRPEAEVNPEFAAYALRARGLGASDDVIPSLQRHELESCEIPSPDPAEQRVISRILRDIETATKVESAICDKLAALKSATMAKLFREGLRGEPTHWVPWDRIELICAGRIVRDDEFRNVYAPRWPSTVVSGLRALALMKPRPISRRARATRIARDPLGEVLIVRRDPRLAFRVVENQMNYAYLGRRLSHSAAENFPIFVADLCARSDAAYITPSTRSLLEKSDPSEHEFPSSQALIDYATHRLLWSWYRRDREAQVGEVPIQELGGPAPGAWDTGDDMPTYGNDPEADPDPDPDPDKPGAR